MTFPDISTRNVKKYIKLDYSGTFLVREGKFKSRFRKPTGAS